MTRCSPYIISSNLAVCIWMMIIPTVRSTLDFHDYKLQGLGNITENIGKDKVAGYFMLPHIYRVFINAGSSREAMDSTKVSKKCQNILHNYRKALSEKDVAAWKMYDATGKQPSGVLFGGTAWKSSYDQCVVEVLKDKSADSKSVSLSPQFCAVYMSSAPWIPSLVKAFKVPFSMQAPSFFVDVCVPKLCSKSDIFNLVDAFLKRNTRDRNVTVESVSCQYSHQITKDPAALISVLVLCFFLLMTLLGSLYEFIVKWHDDWGEECTSDEWIWPVGNKMPEGVLSWFLVSKIAQQLRPKSLSEVEVIKVVQWEDDSLEESLPRFIEDQKNEADGRSSRRKSRVSFHFSDKPYRQKLASAIRNNTRQSRRSIAAESKLSEKSSLTPGFLDARRLTAKPGSFELRPSHRIKRYVASENVFTDLLLSFSFRANASYLLFADSLDKLHPLNGVRVMSITWIVMGNVVGILYSHPELLNNQLWLVRMAQSWWMQAFINTTLAADSFFILSGTLGAYNFLSIKSEMDKERNPCNVLSVKEYTLMIVHRIIRIFPNYIILLLLGTNILPYLGTGPHWKIRTQVSQTCKRNWWSNVLFVNNFYDPDHMCLSHTYFLANDFQFFLFSPIVLVPLICKPSVGFTLIGICVVLEMMVVAGLSRGNNGNVLSMHVNKYWSMIYTKPYSRIGVYCIGLGLGYILYHYDRTWKLKKMPLYTGWVLAVTVTTVLTFVTLDQNGAGSNYVWSWTEIAVYEALSRPAWSLALSWVIFTSSTGQGALVGKFLSARLFLPLCRITYGVFLLHPVIIIVILESSPYSMALTLGQLLMFSFCVLALSHLMSFAMMCCVEFPVTAFESFVILRYKDWQDRRRARKLIGLV